MRRKRSTASTSGLGILDVTQIIFVVLKLVGLIDWSWWIVLIPLWIVLGSFGLLLLLYYIDK